MAGKARVSAIAKELGQSSKDVIAKLQVLGEFVKSASSTIEAPVVRKLRDAFPPPEPAGGSNGKAGTKNTKSSKNTATVTSNSTGTLAATLSARNRISRRGRYPPSPTPPIADWSRHSSPASRRPR